MTRPKAKAIARNFKQMSAAELKALEGLLAESIAARETPAPVATDQAAQRKSTKRDRGEWEEVKIISGRPYRYRRYWQGGKLRSKYLGKV